MVALFSSSSKYSSPALTILLVIVVTTLVVAAMANDLYSENVLYPGQRLIGYTGAQELRWGDCDLYLNTDCNLHIYKVGVGVVWQTNTKFNGALCSLHMQMDGNLVLYRNNNEILWQTNTRGRRRGENVCLLRQDGNVAIYGSPIWSTRKPWHPATTPAAALQQAAKTPPSTNLQGLLGAPYKNDRYVQNVLYEGESLLSGQELMAKSYRLIMQDDCNLVLYNGYESLWTSDTSEHGPHCYLELKRNGNLIIYNHTGYPVWHSGTARGDGDYVLIVQNDGAVVLYSKALWSKPNAVSSGLITTTSNSSSVVDQAMVDAVNLQE